MFNDGHDWPKARNMANELPAVGFVRLWQIVGRPAGHKRPAVPALIPVSRSTWWAGIHAGKYPPPVKLGPHTSAWPVDAIRDLIARTTQGGAQ